MLSLISTFLLCILIQFCLYDNNKLRYTNAFRIHSRYRTSRNSHYQGAKSSRSRRGITMEIFEGNPLGKKIWDFVWRLPFMQPGKQGDSPTTFGDAANVMKNNILQIYGGEESYDGAPIAEGKIDYMVEGSLFLGLQQYYKKYGSVYKLIFGPKSFMIVSDPAIAKFILKDNARAYDKGVLAEILKPIMGKGLIPADPETWRQRRRAIVPGFHKAWYQAMTETFLACTLQMTKSLDAAEESELVVDMESLFCSVSLDIIGKAVFNYDFGSVSKESPVVKAVYRALQEAEHRSITPFPYWQLPLANLLVPRLREFNNDLKLLDEVLSQLISEALSTQNFADVEELERRDYSSLDNKSLLRFLVDMRGENTTSQQLRDDLMTMLVAGHETTAAVLTWSLFELCKNETLLQRARAEIISVLGHERYPRFEDIYQLQFLRLIIAESLRMYPEPPVLIRRALEDHTLPPGNAGFSTRIKRGTDIFIGVYNMHRSEQYWEAPDVFNPDRFLTPRKNPDIPSWQGYVPNFYYNFHQETASSAGAGQGCPMHAGQGGETSQPAGMTGSSLYPNEVQSDFAFLPFGGGGRKCVGDQFAFMEAVIILAVVLRDFDFSFAIAPEEVGMTTGATIHTKNGLKMRVKRINRPEDITSRANAHVEVGESVRSPDNVESGFVPIPLTVNKVAQDLKNATQVPV